MDNSELCVWRLARNARVSHVPLARSQTRLGRLHHHCGYLLTSIIHGTSPTGLTCH